MPVEMDAERFGEIVAQALDEIPKVIAARRRLVLDENELGRHR